MSEQNTVPQLDINDINTALTIIKTAMARGAFKPEEYTSVGIVHDKLASYLDAVKAAYEKQQKEQLQQPVEEVAEPKAPVSRKKSTAE